MPDTRTPLPTNVALSMLTLVRGGMGGSETYARMLTELLSGVDGLSATAFVPATAAGFSAGIPEVVIGQVRGGPSTTERLTAVGSAIVHARAVRAAMSDADVVHYPFAVMAPTPARRQARVQTMHDVQHLDLPHLFSRAELLYRRHFYDRAARSADVVITISEFARQRIVDLLGIPADRVEVSPLGVDTSRYIANRGQRERFVLYPARGWPHKNHARLIQAMATLRREQPDLRLVLTGGGLDSLGALPEWVDRRGLVSEAELHALYRSAAVMAFPSLYEGFGLPPLEAMASGCPVAVSSAGSLPEVCGAAAILFDPADPEAIADGITTAMRDAERLTTAGISHAAGFTWDRCRDAHVAAYRHAAQIRSK